MNAIRRIDAIGAQARIDAGLSIPPDLYVVIPVMNREHSLPGTLSYLNNLGIPPKQIHVVINGCTDNSEQVARDSGHCIVHKQDELLRRTGIWRELTTRVRIDPSRLRGKGLAMLAGVVALDALDLPAHAPVLFLDADISNIATVDPVGHLLAGWHIWEDDRPKLIKLASQGRDNTGMMAFLNVMGLHGLAAFEWPLCGQVIVAWGELRSMRLTTGYGVEMAMALFLWDRYQSTHCFGEVCIGKRLVDHGNPESKDVRMFMQIMTFLKAVLEHGGRMHQISLERILVINQSTAARGFVPSQTPGEHAPQMESVPLDALLPSMGDLATYLARAAS